MIDISKPHRTRDGRRVINLERVPFNSAGRKVTYPIKGSIVVREKPFKTAFEIWSDEGSADVVWNSKPGLDLIPCETPTSKVEKTTARRAEQRT